MTAGACAPGARPRLTRAVPGGSMSVARTGRVVRSLVQALPSAGRRIPARSWLMIFLLFAVPIAAQEGKKDIGDASLEELGNIQVYSASKRLQSTSDAPASVTVITADDIQKYGYRTLADILESVRGFYITYDRENRSEEHTSELQSLRHL